MGTGTKNGKEYFNSTNWFLLFIIALIPLILSGSVNAPAKKESHIIVIDPGHGGRDPGAVGSISYEKDITLAIALRTGKYIEQNLKDVRVVYTRKSDEFVDLDVRSDIANKNNADLFISIHANSSDVHNVYGTETYVMGHSKDQANLEVAMKENQVILLEDDYSTKYEGFNPNSPESYIMFTLRQNVYLKQSTELASMIQTEYKKEVGRFDRGVKQSGFWVLYRTTMPSVLTETGFISNPNEERYINSKQGQDYIAKAISSACVDYINDIDKKSVSTIKANTTLVRNDTLHQPDNTGGSVIYMVQVTASLKKIIIKPDNFKNIKEILEIRSGSRFIYATGSFSEYAQAVSFRKKIQEIYPDAFVIAVKDNKILPLLELLEKNKGK